MRRLLVLCVLAACGDGDHPPDGACTDPAGPFPVGTDGAAQARPVPAGHATAGRVRAGDLPAVPSGLVTWKEGDFVLANDKIAIVIEDVGDSDLYDPWGGRPVGMARVQNGRLIEPAN